MTSQRPEPVVRGEAEDVVAHLVAAREQRILRRHREALEARRVARRNQMQALVVGVPMASDVVTALEAVDGKTFVNEHLESAKSGRSSTDQAVSTWRHGAEYQRPARARARAD
jgi:hypothetical protein